VRPEDVKRRAKEIEREIAEELRAQTRHLSVEEYEREKKEEARRVRKRGRKPPKGDKVIKAAPANGVVAEGDIEEILRREKLFKVMNKAAGNILPRRSATLPDKEYLRRLELRAMFRAVQIVSDARQRINRMIGIYMDFSPVDLSAIVEVSDELKRLERRCDVRMEKMLNGMPIWREWMRQVKGIGPRLAAGFVSEIFDIGLFATVSKLWAYAGMHVVDGRAPRLTRGQQANWNQRLRRLLYNFTDCVIKTRGYYRREYDRCRAKEDELYPELSAPHRQMRARRRVAKLFLAHLWAKWRELERLPVERPWIIEWGGHRHYIHPDEAVR